MCNAPFTLKLADHDEVAARLAVVSRSGAKSAELCPCAKYCFDMMLDREWEEAEMFIEMFIAFEGDAVPAYPSIAAELAEVITCRMECGMDKLKNSHQA